MINGRDGSDVLSGGGGLDLFVFSSMADTPTGFGRDRITDFTQGQDRMVVSAIDARADLDGNQAFVFRGAAGFSGAGGELAYTQGQGLTIVAGDVDGDRVADFQIELAGLIDLTRGDFVL